MAGLRPATRPTLWFVGVSTGGSSIRRVFPAWAEALGLDAVLDGIDFPPGVEPARLREAVAFVRDDPLSRGALVTTHKIDVFRAARDLFDGGLDFYAERLGEVSCLSKRDGRLHGSAKDPVSAGLAAEAFLPTGHFARTGAGLCVLGAGGAATAITWHLLQPGRGPDRPARVVVTDRSPERLEKLARIHAGLGGPLPLVEYRLADGPEVNDAAVAGLPPGSLVVNATGLGKDGPGSPLTDAALFPERGLAWELNYRGELRFLAQARAQAAARGLAAVEDGWRYFVHGWTAAVAEVFGLDLPTAGPGFERLADIAAAAAR